MLKIFAKDNDQVIDSSVAQGVTTYSYALNSILPLINRLGLQRKVQDPKFYDRLKRDVLNGCVMPPITLAYVVDSDFNIKEKSEKEIQDYINNNIEKAFVLDGIQRLSTINRAKIEHPKEFPDTRNIYFTALICKSMDSLLYRMITLNNGQKPMTMRHQIEILTSNLIDFSETDLQVCTEKKSERRRGVFKQSDFVLGYLAFLSNSTTIDNQKLIEEKLDELLAYKIMETDLTKTHIEFSSVLDTIESLCKHQELSSWFKNINNLVGFCSAARKSLGSIDTTSVESFASTINELDRAIASFSISKIKLGQARRNAVSYFTSNFESMRDLGHLEMMERLASHI